MVKYFLKMITYLGMDPDYKTLFPRVLHYNPIHLLPVLVRCKFLFLILILLHTLRYMQCKHSMATRTHPLQSDIES